MLAGCVGTALFLADNIVISQCRTVLIANGVIAGRRIYCGRDYLCYQKMSVLVP